MSNSKMSISTTSSSTKKYKLIHYECLDDIMDFNYEERMVFRVANKRVISNIKARLKKSIDEVAKHRRENFDPNNDGDLIVSTNHIMFEIAKYWFQRFFNSHNDSPKLYRQIRELKQERERLHKKIGELTSELELYKQDDDMDEDGPKLDERELELIKKYQKKQDVEPDVEPQQEVGKLNVQCQVKMVKPNDTTECLID